MSEDDNNQDDFSLSWGSTGDDAEDESHTDDGVLEVVDSDADDNHQPSEHDSSSVTTPHQRPRPEDEDPLDAISRMLEGHQQPPAPGEVTSEECSDADSDTFTNGTEEEDTTDYEALSRMMQPDFPVQEFMPETATTASDHLTADLEPPSRVEHTKILVTPSLGLSSNDCLEETDAIQHRVSTSSLGELLMKAQDELVRVRSRLIESDRQLKRESLSNTEKEEKIRKLSTEWTLAGKNLQELQELLQNERAKSVAAEERLRTVSRERDEAVAVLNSERSVNDLRIRRLVEETEKLSAAQDQRELSLAEQNRVVLAELADAHRNGIALRTEVAGLRDALARERDAFQSENALLRTEGSGLKQRNQKLEAELQHLRVQWHRIQEDGQEAGRQLRETTSALKQAEGLLGRKVAECPDFIRLQHRADSVSNELITADRRNKELQQQLQTANNEVLRLCEEMSRQKRYIGSLEKSITELLPTPAGERSAKALINENCQLIDSTNSLVMRIEAKDQEIQTLRKEHHVELSRLDAALTNMRQEGVKIQNVQMEYERHCTRLDKELQEARAHAQQLKETINTKDKGVAELNDRVVAISQELEQWKRAVHSAQEERLSAVTERLASHSQQLYIKGQLDRECNRTEILTEEIARLTARIDRITEESKKLIAQRDSAVFTKGKLEDTCKELQAKCSKLETEIQQLQVSETDAGAVVSQNQRLVADGHAVLQETISRFENTVVEKHQRLLDLEGEIRKLTNQRDELMRMVEANDTRNADAMKAAIERTKKTLNENFQKTVQAQRLDFKRQADILEGKVQSTNSELNEIRAENVKLQAQKQELQTKATQLDGRARSFAARLQAAQNEVTSLNSQLETAVKKAQELEKQASDLNSKIQKHTSEHERISNEHKKCLSQLEVVKRNNATLKRHLSASQQAQMHLSNQPPTPKQGRLDERCLQMLGNLTPAARKDLYEVIKYAMALALAAQHNPEPENHQASEKKPNSVPTIGEETEAIEPSLTTE